MNESSTTSGLATLAFTSSPLSHLGNSNRQIYRNPDDFDLAQLAKATEGLTGSEIESAFIEALYQAFDEGKEPVDLTISQVLNDLVPLSKLMAGQIAGFRNWAQMATTVPMERKMRKLA